MKKLILSLAIGEPWQRLAEVTHPLMKDYAKRVGADFRAITERTSDVFGPHWEKLAIYDLLGHEYDRVVFLDTDCVLRPDCPDLFELVPESQVGAFNEGLFLPRTDTMREGFHRHVSGTMAWDGRYFNTGVLVVSRQHRVIFKPPNDFSDDQFFEQTYLNVAMVANKVPVHDIRYEMNYLPSMQDFTGLPMEAGHVAHLAGVNPVLARDYALNLLNSWQEYAPDYKFPRKVWMDFGGGLGDIIDAEPVLRYAQKHIFPGDDIRVTTPWPRVFQGHYPNLNLSYGPDNPFDGPCYQLATVPADASSKIFSFLTHVGSNACDFASIGMLHMQLPLADKRIQLTVFDEDRFEIDDLAREFPLDEAALIHAGRSWASRTFPLEYWQAIIDKIAKQMPVCLFGLQGEIHGVLPVEARKGVLDLRDRTTMGGMFELVRRCPVLLTNDSSPVHVAGAFDNSIVLIPSARHPDLVLPWRGQPHPHPYYRAQALYKKLTIDEISRQPCEYYGTHADGPPKGDWSEYLPEVSDVVKAVLSGAKDTT